MPRTEVPLIPVFARWFGSWQLPVERRPRTPRALAAASLAMIQDRRRLVASTAVDILPVLVAAADTGLRLGALPFVDASFDLVIAAPMLEHLPEPVAALAELRRVLRPGVWLVTCMTRLFRMTSLTAIGHNASAGTAGKELKT